jgi:hypothetical protein
MKKYKDIDLKKEFPHVEDKNYGWGRDFVDPIGNLLDTKYILDRLADEAVKKKLKEEKNK